MSFRKEIYKQNNILNTSGETSYSKVGYNESFCSIKILLCEFIYNPPGAKHMFQTA